MMVDYSNLGDRPPSRFIRFARALLPGVDRVEGEIRPYAEAWHERNIEALGSPGPLWVVLGDALSQGIGASSIEQSWVLQTWRALVDRGVRYRQINLSVSGARLRDVVDRQIPAIAGLAAAPDLVTVLIGSNDIVKHDLRAQLPANYRTLLSALPAGTLVATVPLDVTRPAAAARSSPSRRSSARMLSSCRGRTVVADCRDTSAPAAHL